LQGATPAITTTDQNARRIRQFFLTAEPWLVAESRRSKQSMQIKFLSLLSLSFISVALADDFKTLAGKKYKESL
jgi:hypothetical protein